VVQTWGLFSRPDTDGGPRTSTNETAAETAAPILRGSRSAARLMLKEIAWRAQPTSRCLVRYAAPAEPAPCSCSLHAVPLRVMPPDTSAAHLRPSWHGRAEAMGRIGSHGGDVQPLSLVARLVQSH
jgi:hypothetical protein